MFKHLKRDLPASIVVFFVALPLCLGIALASGAPLFSGLIAGIIGGIVVGALSGSQIGVSGPAAGLAAIVLTSIGTLGFENFLLAVVLAGMIQIVLGILKAGVIGYYFPSSVIKGMLSGIGIIIILKQIPHFFGYDADPEGDFAFFQIDGKNTFSEITTAFDYISEGSTLIALIALILMLVWDKYVTPNVPVLKSLPGSLVAVALGVVFYVFFKDHVTLGIASENLVSVPTPDGFDAFISQFSLPNFGAITNLQVWITAFTIALVASLETLLCVEATDKIDPEKHITPTNRELWAQGTGNILSGLIGGLPITQVIVRSSANVQSGGKTKLSAIIHGILLLIAVLLIPNLINLIPLSVLAAILLIVGYKLAKPTIFKQMYDLGWKQFVPFIVTIIGIIFTDLLKGISLGLAVGIVVILYRSYQNSHFLHIKDKSNSEPKILMTLAEEVTFFNKGAILKELAVVPENCHLEIDISKSKYIDNDVIEIIDDFSCLAKTKNITLRFITENGTTHNLKEYLKQINYR